MPPATKSKVAPVFEQCVLVVVKPRVVRGFESVFADIMNPTVTPVL